MGESQRVFITGTSSGFGARAVAALLERGHHVVATMRAPQGRNATKAATLRDAAEDQPGELHVVEADVTEDGSVDAALEKAIAGVGPLDAVINNAGVGAGGLAEAFTASRMRDVFEVNVFGAHRVTRAVAPHLRARGRGLVVFVSSTMGRTVIPFAAPYTASKWALEGLAETYRYELGAAGVDVAIVEPGGFGTSFLRSSIPADDAARAAEQAGLAAAARKSWQRFAKQLAVDKPDPSLVADAIVTLVEAAPGTRPLRTVVDPLGGGQGPEAVNDASARVQATLLRDFDLTPPDADGSRGE